MANKLKRIPRHVGIIPDGNRRWAEKNSMAKQEGYFYGVDPGVRLYNQLIAHGVSEATFYGFTKDNTKRPKAQTEAYIQACIQAVQSIARRDANILVVGRTDTGVFPKELLPFTEKRQTFGNGGININFLINYDWEWDLAQLKTAEKAGNVLEHVGSKGISRMELIIRWGGRRRLSGFLPAQSVYSDFYVVEDYWPDYKEEHFIAALDWYQQCDVTLGG